jgi:hypothetical protein
MKKSVNFAINLGYHAAASAVCCGLLGIVLMKFDPQDPFLHFAAGTTLGLYGGAMGYISSRIGNAVAYRLIALMRNRKNESTGPGS